MTTIDPSAPEDTAAVEDMRKAALAHKGKSLGPAARTMFDAILAATPAPADVRVEAATVGDIRGFWCLPHNAKASARVLFLLIDCSSISARCATTRVVASITQSLLCILLRESKISGINPLNENLVFANG
jgi:hypothetical protein